MTQKYRAMPLEVIRTIKVQWAIGSNINFIRNPHLDPAFNSINFYFINSLDLIQKFDFIGLNTSSLFTGDDPSDFRTARILDNWKKGKYLDPPTIGLNFDNPSFTDGRHRAIAAFHLNEKRIPVALYDDTLEDMLKHVNLERLID